MNVMIVYFFVLQLDQRSLQLIVHRRVNELLLVINPGRLIHLTVELQFLCVFLLLRLDGP